MEPPHATGERHSDRRSTSSQKELRRAGRALRPTTPRSSQAGYEALNRDPVAILDAQNGTRLAELVPLRMSRMAANPFAFFRGTAALMAGDLAGTVSSGIDVVSCGDAHLSNFGFFASPQRTLVFDLNDFDEASVAPWEWDVKRLVASAIIGGRELGHPEDSVRAAALRAAATYHRSITDMMKLTAIQRFYERLDAETIRSELRSAGRAVLDQVARQAQSRTSERFARKMTTITDDGRRMFVDDPPVLTHVPLAERLDIERLFAAYRRTVPADVSLLLSQFELTDTARRVVGVGSVGTRCYVVLLTGPQQESLVLQIKEAQPSVIGTHGLREPESQSGAEQGNEGRRVVANQRVLQAVSDVFLGHLRFNDRDFYVRQFRDMKASIAIDSLTASQFAIYVGGCGRALARAHAQSPNAAKIAGYLGRSDVFDRAVVDWAIAYARQSRTDYDAFHATFG